MREDAILASLKRYHDEQFIRASLFQQVTFVLLIYFSIIPCTFSNDTNLNELPIELGAKLSAASTILSRKYEVETITRYCGSNISSLKIEAEDAYSGWYERNRDKVNKALEVRNYILEQVRYVTCEECPMSYGDLSDAMITYMGDGLKKKIGNEEPDIQERLCEEYLLQVNRGHRDVKDREYEQISGFDAS